jgi:hypothetical protein
MDELMTMRLNSEPVEAPAVATTVRDAELKSPPRRFMPAFLRRQWSFNGDILVPLLRPLAFADRRCRVSLSFITGAKPPLIERNSSFRVSVASLRSFSL